MRIYKTRPFMKWAKKEGISDQDWRSVIGDMEKGRITASLGGRLYKQRVALGKGKRGGARVIVAFVSDDRSFFIYGFCKNETEERIGCIKGVCKAAFIVFRSSNKRSN